MARVLLLLTTTSYRAEDFLDAAASVGVDVLVGTDHEPVLADLAPGGAVSLDFSRPGDSVRSILEEAEQGAFDAVVAAEDEGVLLAAEAARALDLPHDSPEAVRAARDKYLFRRRTAGAGIPTPAFRLVDLDADIARVAGDLRYPCVLKPRSLSASQGVVRADDATAFVRGVERVAAIVEGADPARRAAVEGPELLVEEYVPGREVAVEALLDDGELHVLALFDKPDAPEGPYFEETLFVTPSRLPDGLRRDVVDTTRRAVRAVGLRHGPVHAELRVNDDGVWPLELAPRSIGGRCSRVLRFGSGLSLEELVLRQATGMGVPSWRREVAAAGVAMLPVPRAGVLREVRGRDAARRVEGIVGLDVTIPEGREVEPLPEGNRYLGFLYARAERPEDVERALRDAWGRLEVVIDAGGDGRDGAEGETAGGRTRRRRSAREGGR